MKESNMKIFSGSSNPELAAEVAASLGMNLGAMELKRFSDGELSVKVTENIRGADIFLIQSTGYPANDNIMELLLIIDAFRRASARRITAVLPYYGYGRQDRKVEPRVPISAKVVAKIIESAGANRVLAMDLHADQIQGFFDIPVDHLFAAPVLINYLKELNLAEMIVVSPDSGGAERARFFGKHLDCSMAIIDKRRERANESEVMNIIGDVKGKNCILLDDMIDTAGTITHAAEALKAAGAKSVLAAATHGVLSGPAMERLARSPIEKVIVTNTLRMDSKKQFSKMQTLSVAGILGEAILRIHEERSVSTLFI